MPNPKLYINTLGNGQDIVLLHGWGVNSAVFEPLKQALSEYRVHYVDLPGFGDSDPIEGDIDIWAAALATQLPDNAIWLGWSLGGLVATQVALTFPTKIKALITVASSPCFMAQPDEKPQPWPGIAPQVLSQFSQQLHKNLPKTIERFLAIQAMGSETAKADIQMIKHLVLAKPLPCEDSLLQGLTMLAEVDLRYQLHAIKQPWLRIWGKSDSLVPKSGLEMLVKAKNIDDIILAKASHAPFISHSSLFIEHLCDWIKGINS
ncbi:pimeloyl-ACP methyl ester esterase BioH [Shewanella sp. HL-SH5]|uniref:pimeloyl-ACP methyl ester esterase BioH n=1 Tax=Shewanella sp. HL-SH5 TaxID=3436241 RepID=UPI003EBA317A